MGIYVLESEQLRVEISTFGAELQSIRNKTTGFEYLWHGDKAYWARRSPILFPIVGKVWNGRMHYEGKEYLLSQHGFARDCEFTLVENSKLELVLNRKIGQDEQLCGFVLNSTDETRQKYPFDFSLYIMYRLSSNQLEVNWIVENRTKGDMYFQIGAHPAFNYRDFDEETDIQGYMKFDREGKLSLTTLECGGYAARERREVEVSSEGIAINKSTFAGDALVFEKQLNRVALCDKLGNPYVEVEFDAPVVGLWSPAKAGYAPFMCIEPWYGRCDDSNFEGDYNEKPYINCLKEGELFHSTYKIILK
ncbi:MAG: aldose 1-epimerase family protein [Paludibacteraceae bacterium]|nr:aldose 1-epimerase family protein [Paludibacteraceae bacterium]